MGSAAAASHVPAPDVVVSIVPGPAQPAVAREVDVDDVRALLKELRLRRQLRAQD